MRAFGQRGVAGEDVVGDDETEHRVAEELESFVGFDVAVLGAPAAVTQGGLDQLDVGEVVTDAVAEGIGSGRGVQDDQPRRACT